MQTRGAKEAPVLLLRAECMVDGNSILLAQFNLLILPYTVSFRPSKQWTFWAYIYHTCSNSVGEVEKIRIGNKPTGYHANSHK